MNNSDETNGTAYKHRIKYQGETYTLTKLKQTKSAPWYLRIERGGKVIKRCLNTPDADLAEKAAKNIIQEANQQNWARLAELKTRQPTVPGSKLTLWEVYECFRDKVSKTDPMSRSTVHKMWGIWCLVLKRSDPGIVPERFPISGINEELARRFRDAFVGEYLSKIDETDEQARKVALRAAYFSGRSMCSQAASLFKKSRVKAYRADHGLDIPDSVFQFGANIRDLFDDNSDALVTYNRPSDEIIALTFKHFAEMDTTDVLDRNVFLAFWFAVACAIRKGEMVNLKWEEVQIKDGKPHLDSPRLCKGKEYLAVPVLDDAWAKLQPSRKESGLVLEGSITERQACVFKRISAIMRKLGWGTKKKYHEIRKYIGSKIAEQLGILAAAQFLRHKDTVVLTKFYTRYLNPPKFHSIKVLPVMKVDSPLPAGVANAA